MFGRFNKVHRKAVAIAAERLAVQIEALKSDESLEGTFSDLQPIVSDAVNGRLRKPPKFIPGRNAYFELFEPYPALNDAYALFCLVASVSDYHLVQDIAERNELLD